MPKKQGILYGLGVGPGDPELVTLKAARILNVVDVVFAAASTKNTHSLAVSIAKPHIRDLATVRMLKFPMTRDKDELSAAWKSHARTIIDEVEQGKNVAFLTLGDLMTYSTYGYVIKHVQQMAPHLPIISVPGVTSYQAAASAVNMTLVEGEESLLVMSGAEGGERLRELTDVPDTVVFLKAYKNCDDIASALEENGLLENSVAVSRASLPDQEIYARADELCERAPKYWTLVIAKKKKHA